MLRDARFEREQAARHQMAGAPATIMRSAASPSSAAVSASSGFERAYLGLGLGRFGRRQIGWISDGSPRTGPGRQGGVPIRADKTARGPRDRSPWHFPAPAPDASSLASTAGHLRLREARPEGQGDGSRRPVPRSRNPRRRRDACLYDQFDQPLRLPGRGTSARRSCLEPESVKVRFADDVASGSRWPRRRTSGGSGPAPSRLAPVRTAGRAAYASNRAHGRSRSPRSVRGLSTPFTAKKSVVFWRSRGRKAWGSVVVAVGPGPAGA